MYGNRFAYGGPSFFPPVIKWLLIANAVIFVIGMVSPAAYEYLMVYGALWPIGSEFFMPWQYITYMFLHGGFMHILFNMFGLWMFGMEIENLWGSKRFLVFYLLSGLGAAIIHSLVTLAEGVTGPTVGASGAIFGVVVAFGLTFPDRMVLAFMFIPMRAKYFVLLYIALDLYAAIANLPGDNVAHFAHLGGALVGFVLYKTGFHATLADRLRKSGRRDLGAQPPSRVWSPPQEVGSREREGSRVIDARFHDVPSHSPRPTFRDLGTDQARLDEILDKIRVKGYQNLTQDEKDFLVETSKRMR